MLRITKSNGENVVTLKLEGKLLGPWIGEARRTIQEAVSVSGRVLLDLSALTFVDSAGTGLLLEFVDRGIKIGACSNFVSEILSLERHHDDN